MLIVLKKKINFVSKNRDDDPLLRSLGFRAATPSPSQSGEYTRPSTSSGIGQKRPNEGVDTNVPTKLPAADQVSSTGTGNTTSKLWEKNRMLASLLAQQPTQVANIPPVPASVISATPQV